VPRKQLFLRNNRVAACATVLLGTAAATAAALAVFAVFVFVERALGNALRAARARRATGSTACRGTASAAAASSLCRKWLRRDAGQRQSAEQHGRAEESKVHVVLLRRSMKCRR
jgi:hypothetical protein